MRKAMLSLLGILFTVGVTTTFTADGGRNINVQLSGYEETLIPLSTTGTGHFVAKINDATQTIQWRLSYDNLVGQTLQAHIHFGASRQSGGISVFLCTNLGNGPINTQACPQSATESNPLTGTIIPADVIGPIAQGIAAGEFAELVAAIRAGATYVNIHSSWSPGGEIRAQLDTNRGQNEQDHHHH